MGVGPYLQNLALFKGMSVLANIGVSRNQIKVTGRWKFHASVRLKRIM
jgi:hypothetical protein